MPFLEDFESDEETLRHPLWGTFALLKDDLERLVAINVGWSLQLVPAMLALAFPDWPGLLRLLLVAYSALLLVPATALLFACAARLSRHEPPAWHQLREDWRSLALPSFFGLAPLPGLLVLGYFLAGWLGLLQLLWLEVLLRLLLLTLAFSAVYWGPLFICAPGRSPWWLLRTALLLAWRYPGSTLLLVVLTLLLALLGYVSIAGFFLIVPVLVALLLVRRSMALLVQERQRRHGLKVGVL